MDTDTQITIRGYTGGPEGVDLKECHFQQIAHGEFLFFVPRKPPVHVKNGEKFTFNFQELNWTAAFVYLDSLGIGAGVWSALPAGDAGAGKDAEDPESGTFQAQNGPGAGGDLEASASASA